MPRTFSMNVPNDEIIIADEIKEIETQDADKNVIILRAAEKLVSCGKYSDDLTIICSRLCRQFKSISPSYFRGVLPKPYKREYNTPTDTDIPETLIEEFLSLSEDIAKEIASLSSEIFRKIRKDKEFEKTINDQFTKNVDLAAFTEKLAILSATIINISNLPDRRETLNAWIGILKEYQAEIAVTRQLKDERNMFTTFQWIILKISILTHGFEEIGKIIHYSSKWISVQDKTDKLLRLLEKTKLCPRCDFNAHIWYEKQLARQKLGHQIQDAHEVPL